MLNKLKSSENNIILSSDLLEKFDISLGTEIAEFSSEFAKAYPARSKNSDNGEFYALIFSNNFAADLDKMNILRGVEENSIQKLVDFGRIRTSQSGDNLCAIMHKPKGENLKDMMVRGDLDENIITSLIFPQLHATISFLHSKKIMHGCINPESLYYDASAGRITLKESISEYIGFSQLPSFETFERMVCHKAGKSYREFEADYYAMGICLCYLMNGEYVFKGIPDDVIKKGKLEKGSYKSFYEVVSAKLGGTISPRNENLIKGLINDDSKDRWGDTEVKKWLNRDMSPSLTSKTHKQSSRPFEFEGDNFYSPKYLAHIAAKNWGIAKRNLSISEVSKWLTFTSRYSDIENRLFLMRSASSQNQALSDEKLSRIFILMDEDGPLRYRNITFNPDGFGNLLAYLNFSEDTDLTNDAVQALELGLIEAWIKHQTKQKNYSERILGWNTKDCKLYSKRKEIGFSYERVLYETAKYLPCQSTVTLNQYSIDLPNLLKNLDSRRLSYNDENSIDNHICAFIAKYVGLKETVKIKDLNSFPNISKAKEVKYCALMALAQTKTEISSLPALTQWVRESLNNVIDNFNSRNIKVKATEKLDKAVPKGDLNKIFSIITNYKMIKTDSNGFLEAKKQYRLLNFEIVKLKSQRNLDQLAYKIGLKASVIFSYLICIISILSLMLVTF